MQAEGASKPFGGWIVERGSSDNELNRVWSKVYSHSFIIDLSDIRNLLGSEEPEDRLCGLVWLRRWIQERSVHTEFFDLAEPLIEDSNNNCRWQALILIGNLLRASRTGSGRSSRNTHKATTKTCVRRSPHCCSNTCLNGTRSMRALSQDHRGTRQRPTRPRRHAHHRLAQVLPHQNPRYPRYVP